MTEIYPAAEHVLRDPTRTLAGQLLLLIKGDASGRVHPKNIRNYIDAAYPGSQGEEVWAHVLQAFELLKRDGYLYNDYKDVISADWCAVTEKGEAVTDPRQLENLRQSLFQHKASCSLVAVSFRARKR